MQFTYKKVKVKYLLEQLQSLTPGQHQQVLVSLQNGSGVVIEPTKKQRSQIIGTLFASIAAPMILKSGHGLRNRIPNTLAHMFHLFTLVVVETKEQDGVLFGRSSPLSGIPLLGNIL